MLADLRFQQSYRKDRSELVRDFYIPCLREAAVYWRGVGYFSAASLSAAATGMAQFINGDGKIRLVASPMLLEADVRAIRDGYEQRETVIARALVRGLDAGDIPDPVRHRLGFLSWLIANERLDIKVAILETENGIGDYHEKLGLFFDREGNTVAFTGSANESANGLVSNFERLDVFCSWIKEDESRIPSFVDDFEAMWNNTTPNLTVIDFPEAAKLQLLRFQPRTKPSADEDVTSGSAHYLKIALKPRQDDAIAAWRAAGCRGILEMATGTGKTIAAIGCAAGIGDLALLMIAVPSIELVEQWISALAETSTLTNVIKASGSAAIWMQRFYRALSLANDPEGVASLPITVVGTYDSLSDPKTVRLIDDAGGLPSRSMLVCDEVHRVGAPAYQAVMLDRYSCRLGLSATPIRKYDESGNELIDDYFGGTVFTFDIGQAIAAKVLAPYDYTIYFALLTNDEYAEYQDLTASIGRLSAAEEPERADRAKLLLIKRANILRGASAKVELIEEILSKHSFRSGLIYCSDIEQAGLVAARLSRAGQSIARYSSDDVDRQRILREFARGRTHLLAAIKCLDEGVDIPSCDFALLLASDSSERQFIQRRGRVLRRADPDKVAQIVDVFILPPSSITSAGLFEGELRRVLELIKYARNRLVVTEMLARKLAPFGINVSDLVK